MSYANSRIEFTSGYLTNTLKSIAQAKGKIDILGYIEKIFTNCYDSVFYIEEIKYINNGSPYSSREKITENVGDKFFKSLNRIKRLAIKYYDELKKFENNNSENNTEFENILSDSDEKRKELEDEYEDIKESFTQTIDLFLNNIRNYVDSYGYNYRYIPSDMQKLGNDIFIYQLSQIFGLVKQKNTSIKNKMLTIATTDSIEEYTRVNESLSSDLVEKYGVFYSQPKNNNTLTFDKYIIGDPSDCKISNGVFDIVYCDASNISMFENCTKTTEYSALVNSMKFLKPDGLLVYTTYYFRYTKDVCSVLARYMRDAKIITCKEKGFITVIGYRKKDKVSDQELYTKLRSVIYYYDFSSDSLSDVEFNIEPANLDVSIFRGAHVTSEMIKSLYESNNLFDSIDLTYANENKDDKHPLLPFSLGQLGLVLTSGCLDGVIKEKDPNGRVIGCHAIKGEVNKITELTTADDHKNTREETISNKVSINIFKPNGELISLA